MKSNKIFRRCLDIAMFMAILGTIPYMVDGQTQYRHEVYGVTALALAAFHCIENRFWFAKNFGGRDSKESRDLKESRDPKDSAGKAARFRRRINFLLTFDTVIVLISGIMISNVVFRFLRIPYHEFWHYVHFASGVAFLILVTVHIWNHRRKHTNKT